MLLGARQAGNRSKTGSIPTQTGEPILDTAAKSRSAALLTDCVACDVSGVVIVNTGYFIAIAQAKASYIEASCDYDTMIP